MKPASKKLKIAGLVSILMLPAIFLILMSSGKHKFNFLPYYGPKTPIAEGDTLFHTLPPFALTDQNGSVFTDENLTGKIVVADFFFTTCPTICPVMSNKMRELQFKLTKDPAFNDVHIVSHTVDPETDTPQVLDSYAYRIEADLNNWTFLTGNKDDIYQLATEGYLVSAMEDVEAAGGFLHSEKFVLLDRQHHIRGFYDGTDFDDVNRLFDEIKVLLKEEKVKAAEAK